MCLRIPNGSRRTSLWTTEEFQVVASPPPILSAGETTAPCRLEVNQLAFYKHDRRFELGTTKNKSS